MAWKTLTIMTVVCSGLVAVAARAERPAVQWQPDLATAWKAMEDESRPMLVFVTSSNCRYCEKMKRETFGDAGVVEYIDQTFVAATFNGGQEPALAKHLSVSIYPTTVIIGPDAKILDSIRGYVSAERLQQRLNRVAVRSEDSTVR